LPFVWGGYKSLGGFFLGSLGFRVGAFLWFWGVVGGASGCRPPPIDLTQLRRIDIEGRFVTKRPQMSPVVQKKRVVVQGKRLRALLAAVRCKQGTVLWKGGIPATLLMRDGRRVEIDGFSFYGRFFRVHSNQWCVVSQAMWKKLWQIGQNGSDSSGETTGPQRRQGR
jgi:hypothetical protein